MPPRPAWPAREAKRLPYEFCRCNGAISNTLVGDGFPVPFPPTSTNVTNRAGQGKNDHIRTKHEYAAGHAGPKSTPENNEKTDLFRSVFLFIRWGNRNIRTQQHPARGYSFRRSKGRSPPWGCAWRTPDRRSISPWRKHSAPGAAPPHGWPR